MAGSTEVFDVIVAGGGPGGALAALLCARSGLKTLLLEKRRLPRDKVCSGMIMGPWAHTIVEREFGSIPQDILTDPPLLAGHMIHAPGAEPQIVECRTPMAWRKNLDFWMVQKAREQGAEIRDAARLVHVSQENSVCSLNIEKKSVQSELKARFVVGADGAGSAVRKSLFPELKVRYSAPVRECYKGSLDIDRNYYHWFFPRERARPRFGLHHKEDFFLIEGGGIRELREEINQILAPHGFNPDSKPLWKDGCLEALLHLELISGAFFPAAGNILLVGDAAGLIFPITFEGIGAALKSASLAAESILQADKTNEKAAGVYAKMLRPVIESIGRLHGLNRNLEEAADEGVHELSRALASAYAETLKVR